MGRALSIVLMEMGIGGFVLLLFAPPTLLGRGFYRFMGGFYTLLWGLTLWIEAQIGRDIREDKMILGVLMGLYAVLAWTPFSVLGYGLLGLAIPVGGVVLWGLDPERGFLEAIRTSLLLGSATTAMLLGHWYLTTPDLSTRYLRRLNRVLMGTFIVSAFLFVVRVATSWSALKEKGYVAIESFGGVFLWGRALVGFGGAGVCVALTWFCVREDSTQAATGFLYLVVLFLLMGEFLSQFLKAQTQLPL